MNIKKILEKANDQTNKNNIMQVDINMLQTTEEQFLSSIIDFLKKKGYGRTTLSGEGLFIQAHFRVIL